MGTPDYTLFKDVDDYIESRFAACDTALEAALYDSDAAGLPQISITANQGKLLYLLAKIAGAKRILEIGLLGGYSTIWLARALPEGGKLVSLELEEKHARVAQKNIERAGLDSKVEIRLGSAMQSLEKMIADRAPSFDFVFIDADKCNYPGYLELSLKLSHSGTVIVGDNVIRNGKIFQKSAGDADLIGIQKFNEAIATNPRLESLLVPCMKETLDGFSISRVK